MRFAMKIAAVGKLTVRWLTVRLPDGVTLRLPRGSFDQGARV